MTTIMDIVIACENHLGWQPEHREGQEHWKPYAIEVFKLKKLIANGKPVPTRFATITNLALALEYSRRKKLPVSSPVALLHRIPDALALANQPRTPSSVEVQIQTAIAWEQWTDDEHSLRWIHRLVRSSGDGRAITLADWKQAGRG